MVMNVVATTSMITTALGLGMMGRRGGAGIEGIISWGKGRGGFGDGMGVALESFLFFPPLGVFLGVAVRACFVKDWSAVRFPENELWSIRYE
jgi:hypothetical protein